MMPSRINLLRSSVVGMTQRKPEYAHLSPEEARRAGLRRWHEANPTRSPEVRAKISASLMGQIKHGHTPTDGKPTATYYSWSNMIQRCTNPNNTAYANYGGRGITVCERWRSFANFLADMGERPDGSTIERIDNDRGYEPGNCRWATRSEQQQNRRPRRQASEETKAKLRAAWTRRKARADGSA